MSLAPAAHNTAALTDKTWGGKIKSKTEKGGRYWKSQFSVEAVFKIVNFGLGGFLNREFES